MSKRKKQKNITLPYKNDISFYENLLRYVADGKKTVVDVIGYLSMLSAKCMVLITQAGGNPYGLPESDKDNILGFYENFLDEFGEITEEARYDNWGDNDAFILRIGEMLEMEEHEQEKAEILADLTDEERKECEEYADSIINIPGAKHLTYAGQDYDGCEMSLEQEIPSKAEYNRLDGSEKEYYRSELMYGIAVLLNTIGGVTVNARSKNGGIDLYGIRFFEGSWEPITAEEMEDADTKTPSGYRLAPRKGVHYSELPPRKNTKLAAARPAGIIGSKTAKTAESKSDRSIFTVIK